MIYVGVGFSSNRIIKYLQIVIIVWMEEFFFELYLSAKSQCINLFLNTLMEGLDSLILHETMCDLAIIKVMLMQGFI